MSIPIKVSHETMQKILADIEANDNLAAEVLPTEKECLNALCYIERRLKKLGFSDALYAPKDGSNFQMIEFGSSGIHEGFYEGEWPHGGFQVLCGDGDTGPSHPIMYRLKQT
jgi:hypothetical protein